MHSSIIMYSRLWTQHSSRDRGAARFLLSVHDRQRKLAAPFFVAAETLVISRRVLLFTKGDGSPAADSRTVTQAIRRAPLGQ
jgi:hypothetical protein